MQPDDEEPKTTQIDLASLFPSKGDPRRPPEWFGRGLLYIAIAVFLSVWVWNAWASIQPLVLIVVISIFVALAMNPIVEKLVKHGWRRGAASGVTLIGVCVAVVALCVEFGQMFVQQVIQMIASLPNTYLTIGNWVKSQFGYQLPQMEDLGDTILKWVQSHTNNMEQYAGQAWKYVTSVGGAVFAVFTVLLVTYYMSACAPSMRKSFCRYMSPRSQKKFLVTWTVLQDQISNFLYSRIILALISSACMSVFLVFMGVPYWLPLSLFCGLVSQFVPTIGTYIGGAIPVLSVLTTNGLKYAIIVVVYIVIYQQIENLLLSPKISQRTMDINPAVAFLVVVLFGYLFGALGAFLALPVWASIQVLFKMYTKHYDLIDSPLLNDQKTVRKSAMVQGAETVNERIIKPVADRLPRVARGSSKHATVEDEYQQLLEDEFGTDVFAPDGRDDQDDSETVAIPQHAPGPDDTATDDGDLDTTDVTEGLRHRNEQGPAPEKSKFRKDSKGGSWSDGGTHADDDANGTGSRDDEGGSGDGDGDNGGSAHRSSFDHPAPAKPRKGHSARKEWN